VPLQEGGLYVRCDRQGKFGPRSELCLRQGQSGWAYNNLACWPSDRTGIDVGLHTRKPGAAHTLCGTAGVNESRVMWYDGFQDDFFSFSTMRTAGGRLVSAQLITDELPGRDLLTPGELEMGDRKEGLRMWQSSNTSLKAAFRSYFAGHANLLRRQ